MYGEERQRATVTLARREGRVSVNALAATFGVAAETIRRDLAVLEQQGLLRRVHGGAIAVDRPQSESTLSERAHTMTAEKQRIAKAASDEIPEAGAIFVEAGSTPGALAALLPADRPLTVITNGGYIAMTLGSQANLTVLLIGGRVRHRTLACVDDWALQTLAGLYVDVAFLGTNGISLTRGLTTPNPAEAAVKRASLQVAPRRVLLADHTKFGAVSPCRYGEVADVDVIITDSGLSDDEASEFEAAGTQVVRA